MARNSARSAALAFRPYGSMSSGKPFSDWVVDIVWNKAIPIPGYDPATVRWDPWGAIIARYSYGDSSPDGYGWEIDHILPVCRGGTDDVSNLQPLHWKNNRSKGNSMALRSVP